MEKKSTFSHSSFVTMASLCWDEVSLYWFVCQTAVLSWQYIDWIVDGCRRRGLDEIPGLAAPFYTCAGCLQVIQASIMLLVFIPTGYCEAQVSEITPEGNFYYWIPTVLFAVGVHSLHKAYRFSEQIEKPVEPFLMAGGFDELPE